MSVVNKMLQDLEARKAHPDEINADYQPPQKQQSKWLIYLLLVLAIVAITFALADVDQLFNSQGKTVLQNAVPVSNQEVAKIKQPNQKSASQLVQADKIISDAGDITEPKTTELANKPLPSLDKRQEILASPTEVNITENTQVSLVPEMPILSPVIPAKQPSFSMSGSTREHQSTNLKQRIAESLNNNDLDLAQSLLSELLLEEPDNLNVRKKLASLYFAQGNYSQTKQLLVRGIDLYPRQTDLRLMLARLYSVQDDISQAMKVMAGVEPGIDNQTEYLAYRAALAQQLKQTQVSKADYLTLTSIDSNNAKWWLGLAIAQDQLGDINKALKAYDKAYALGQLTDSVDQFIQQRISVLAGTK